MAASGSTDVLVAGGKRDLLALRLFEGTKIITVRDFLVLRRRMPDRLGPLPAAQQTAARAGTGPHGADITWQVA